MTNVLIFPGLNQSPVGTKSVKAKAKGKAKTTAIAPDAPIFCSSMDQGIKIAGYIYGDMEAVDMLQAEQRRWLERKQGFGYLPFEIRKRCAKYLIDNEEFRESVRAALHLELGA